MKITKIPPVDARAMFEPFDVFCIVAPEDDGGIAKDGRGFRPNDGPQARLLMALRKNGSPLTQAQGELEIVLGYRYVDQAVRLLRKAGDATKADRLWDAAVKLQIAHRLPCVAPQPKVSWPWMGISDDGRCAVVLYQERGPDSALGRRIAEAKRGGARIPSATKFVMGGFRYIRQEVPINRTTVGLLNRMRTEFALATEAPVMAAVTRITEHVAREEQHASDRKEAMRIAEGYLNLLEEAYEAKLGRKETAIDVIRRRLTTRLPDSRPVAKAAVAQAQATLEAHNTAGWLTRLGGAWRRRQAELTDNLRHAKEAAAKAITEYRDAVNAATSRAEEIARSNYAHNMRRVAELAPQREQIGKWKMVISAVDQGDRDTVGAVLAKNGAAAILAAERTHAASNRVLVGEVGQGHRM